LTRLSPSRFFASTALATVLAAGLAGCQTTAKGPDTTGSIGTASRPTTEAEWRVVLDRSEALYKARPDDVGAAMQYAQALRATGQHTQAVAVLEQVSLKNSRNKQLLGAYGRALAEVGRYAQALEVLSRAHTPDMPDWRILSAQGAVLDQLGRYEDARRHYAAALKIAPDEPSVLSNLGLSYALSKDLKKAEATLRKATAQPGVSPRVRQNLALVIGLQGHFKEAEEIARADLPPDEATANVDYLRQMLAQQKGELKLKSAKPKPAKPATTASAEPERS
jgi:Flp pilus assembly protein TadD